MVRDVVAPRPEVVHDANEYLMSDPLDGVGIPSSYPAFEEAMTSYFSGAKIKRTSFDKNLKWIVDEVEKHDPPVPPNAWQNEV